MFGVMVFVLNESKFIRYALRGYLSSKLVTKIAVVEGCVEGNKHAGNDQGLSTDNTARVISEVMGKDDTDRILFEQMGFVRGKSDLQNRCIELLEQHASGIEYFLLAGGDEVYDPADLKRLKQEIERLGKPDVPLCEFVHFWKRPDLRATGSTWDVWMHRCYRNHGKGMRFDFHAGPPLKPNGSRLKPGVKVDGVRVYHYAAMKDRKDIKDRLKLYQNRDGKGTDTWTSWKPGRPTQWTHGGGTAEMWEGGHPPAIADYVWDLVPDVPKPKTVVFLAANKADREEVAPFIRSLARNTPVTVIGLTNPRWKGIKFKRVNDLKKQIKGADLLVVANRHVIPRPLAKKNVILAYGAPQGKMPLRGYRVVGSSGKLGQTWSGKAVVVDHPVKMLLDLDRYPIVKGAEETVEGMVIPIAFSVDGATGKSGIPGKKGSSGTVEVISTSPFIVAWTFRNPLSERMNAKYSHLGYEIRRASGGVVQGYRSVVKSPNLEPGGMCRLELTIPMNLPPNDYEFRFDFRYKNRWGRDRGISPLKMVLHLDSRRKIWVR